MNFDYLAEKLKWNIRDLARKIFTKFEVADVKKSIKYEDLRDIILENELITSIQIPKNNDLAQKINNVRIRSIHPFAKFTRENKYCFALKRPKNNFAYDVSLRRSKY
jgi:hypothetical protein